MKTLRQLKKEIEKDTGRWKDPHAHASEELILLKKQLTDLCHPNKNSKVIPHKLKGKIS